MFSGSSSKSFAPSKLRDSYREILRLKAAGVKDVDIAKKMNLSPVTVGYVVKSPLGKQQLERLHAQRDAGAIDIQAEIAAAQPVALLSLLEMLNDPNHDKREKRFIAQDLLDRGGNSAVKKVAVAHSNMDGDRISRIKQQAEQAAAERGILAEDAKVISEEEDGNSND